MEEGGFRSLNLKPLFGGLSNWNRVLGLIILYSLLRASGLPTFG